MKCIKVGFCDFYPDTTYRLTRNNKDRLMRTILNLLALGFCSVFLLSYASANPVAVEDTLEGGGTLSLTQVTRKNEIVTVKAKVSCKGKNHCGMSIRLEDTFLLDAERGIKYFPIKDSEGSVLASEAVLGYRDGTGLWVKLTAPPKEVTKVTVAIPGANSFEDIDVTDK